MAWLVVYLNTTRLFLVNFKTPPSSTVSKNQEIEMASDRGSLKPPGYHPTPQLDDPGYESSGSNSQREDPLHVEHRRCRTLSAEGWGLEILSSLTSLILLGGMISIFFYMKDRPLSDWQFPISLNAIISILTTACSAAIMHGVSTSISQLKWLHFATGHRKLFSLESFDEASRGPYGSIKFLFTIRWNLATIGALVTIFRLGLAPLAQQVVSLEARDVITPDESATFGFAHTYDRDKNTVHACKLSRPHYNRRMSLTCPSYTTGRGDAIRHPQGPLQLQQPARVHLRRVLPLEFIIHLARLQERMQKRHGVFAETPTLQQPSSFWASAVQLDHPSRDNSLALVPRYRRPHYVSDQYHHRRTP